MINPKPTQSPTDFYKMSDKIALKKVTYPYTELIHGMEINMSNKSNEHTVLANSRCNTLCFNKTKNLFGLMIAAMTLDKMRMKWNGQSEHFLTRHLTRRPQARQRRTGCSL